MNFLSFFHVLSTLLAIPGLALAVCGIFSAALGEPAQTRNALFSSAVVALLASLMLKLVARKAPEPTRRDGFGVVTLGWVALAILGILPYMLSGTLTSPVDALFESMSGFTTTGASVIRDVEAMPRSILLWRALSSWLGGMGVLVLCVAILPMVGSGGMQVFQAEMSGPSKERLTPRIAATAKLLWGIYTALTLSEAALLKLGGLPWFDALCHAFTTVSTSGFSTRNAGIGAYNSLYVEAVVTAFMFLGAINFALHFRAIRGGIGRYFKDAEFRYYLGAWLTACLALAAALRLSGTTASTPSALRQAFFTATSIITTTGYSTVDFNLWPGLLCLFIILLMFMGGCAGSTSGGIKVIRIFVVLKSAFREIKAFLQPQAAIPIKIGRETMEHSRASAIIAFVMVFILSFIIAAAALMPWMPDSRTAFSAAAAMLCNVGPGLGAVGPASTYAGLPGVAKGILIFCMLLGRLELYTVLVLLLPSFWRR